MKQQNQKSDEMDQKDVPATDASLTQPVSQPPDVDLAEEWKQKYLRALADYQNLEKRSAVREDEGKKFAAEVTLRKFLPAIDSLTLAAHHVQDEGLRLALKEFAAALESCGVKRMDVVKTRFDPFMMECIDVVDGDPEIVIEEVTPGYMFFDKVLRVAQVKVGKKKARDES